MHAEFRKALNLAARVVEEEAIMFDEEASVIMPHEVEAIHNREKWEKFKVTRGRAHSLRKLAMAIRNIKS